MEIEPFIITYQNKPVEVHPQIDLNDEFFYKVILSKNEEIDVYIAPPEDGMAPNWAEGKGALTNRAKEIGELIENHES